MDDQGEEWVGDVGDGDQELAGAQGAEAFRGGVGGVAELADGFQDAATGGLRHLLGVAQDPGDGGGGDLGGGGDVEDGGQGGPRGVRPWSIREVGRLGSIGAAVSQDSVLRGWILEGGWIETAGDFLLVCLANLASREPGAPLCPNGLPHLIDDLVCLITR